MTWGVENGGEGKQLVLAAVYKQIASQEATKSSHPHSAPGAQAPPHIAVKRKWKVLPCRQKPKLISLEHLTEVILFKKE